MKRSRWAAVLVIATGSLAFVFGVGSAGAAPKVFVGCGSTVDSSITLQADLNCAGTTGLEIGNDKVTVNLNGHSITDTLGGGDGETGIEINGYDKVKIKNGTIQNFATGIYSGDGTDDITVSNMTIWLDGNNDCDFGLYGIYLEETFKAQVKNVTVNNSGDALLCGIGEGSEYVSYGIFSEDGNQLTVSNSTVNDVFFAFFDVSGFADKWSNNTANNPYDLWNGEDPSTGFFDLFGFGNSYVGDTANGGTTGFRLISDGDWVQTLKNSTANGNSNDGAYMFASNNGPTGTIVSGNTFNGNGNEGMHGAFNYGMAFSKNTAILNGFDPQCCGQHGNGFNFFAACDAKFSQNTANNNYNSGFRLGGWCGNEKADKNTANNNADDGFHLNSNNTCTGSFTKNKAFGNGDAGAVADNYFIPGLGNTTDTFFDNVNISNICD